MDSTDYYEDGQLVGTLDTQDPTKVKRWQFQIAMTRGIHPGHIHLVDREHPSSKLLEAARG